MFEAIFWVMLDVMNKMFDAMFEAIFEVMFCTSFHPILSPPSLDSVLNIQFCSCLVINSMQSISERQFKDRIYT